MINRLLASWHRPEKGWDPVPEAHAKSYADNEWAQGVQDALLDELDRSVGGLAGKTVLDLGGGPGQYSVAFAQRGALVTWHDVSSCYRRIAGERARQANAEVRFSLGYLDEAPMILASQFDLVFNRICWNYCMDDADFAAAVFALVKPGGVGYVDVNTSAWKRESLSLSGRVRTWTNEALGIKVGHPYPPRGRVPRLFLDMPIERIAVDYQGWNDRVLFFKRKDAA